MVLVFFFFISYLQICFPFFIFPYRPPRQHALRLFSQAWAFCLSLVPSRPKCIPARSDQFNKQKGSYNVKNGHTEKFRPGIMWICLSFIPLWEWMWCHRAFYVRQDWKVHSVVRSQENTQASIKKGAVLKRWHTCRDGLWCHVHSQSGMKFIIIIVICSFCNARLPTHWVLKAPLCDSRSAHIGY